ncbi:uncharacterized protein LOC113226236 [Hyposmocoma kahamanoa]|uniref:uncharacterized protein LOC113226236 n=1 Tax=Hyposmocoma kahamanoa TaxID=1477025 RepID=UPI000E6D5C83|nr:uncharacterized protein LOC113226236 [Hyposmocoma kahamanoa]
MVHTPNNWPLVPGSPALPSHGSSFGNRAWGAKNPRGRPGYHQRRRLYPATYNTRTLRTDAKLTELEEVICLCSDLDTPRCPDDEVEAIYEDILKAIHSYKTHYTDVMGDFNAKLGKRCGDELRVGQFGVGQRNARGRMLVDFMEKENLYIINTFLRKSPTRKWSWMSPDGSDHRLIRDTLNINIRLERTRLIEFTLRPIPAQLQNPESFQLELQNCFEALENCINVDDLNNMVVDTVRTVGSKFFKTHRTRIKKLSDKTLQLMEHRNEMQWRCSNGRRIAE